MGVASLAREHSPKAIETLRKIMEDESQPGSTRVAAANSLLDRGFGRAQQSIEILAPPTDTQEFPTIEEVNAELRRRGLMPVLELVAEERRDAAAPQITDERPRATRRRE